ncbi:DUF397 domain-containing protein [Streptomyces albus]|uniref:DUF397 domain-containing protein n=1 Tax=Streptomyces albus TaxID=1888 RepID=UPI0004CAB113|nr:DUF397 domain-containing protein [Streptomyces albus]
MTPKPSPGQLAVAEWRKSRHSAANNECVEIADLGPWVAIRDSKDRRRPALTVKAGSFTGLIAALKSARFTA